MNHQEVLCKFEVSTWNKEIDRNKYKILKKLIWKIIILVKLQTSTTDKVVDLNLGRRWFLIKLQVSSFSKVRGSYQWRIHFRISSFREADLHKCSYKKVFLKYAENLQEITNAEVRF